MSSHSSGTRSRYDADDSDARARALASSGIGFIPRCKSLVLSMFSAWIGCCSRSEGGFSTRAGKYVTDTRLAALRLRQGRLFRLLFASDFFMPPQHSLRFRPLFCLAIAASLLCFSPAARASTYYWDGAPNTTGTSLNYSSGTISTTSSNWWPTSGAAYSGWTNSLSDTMQIGSTGTNNGRAYVGGSTAPSFTLTLSGTTGMNELVVSGNLTSGNTVTVSNGGVAADTITFGSGGIQNNSTTNSLIINATILTASVALLDQSAGTVILTASNGFTSGINIEGGGTSAGGTLQIGVTGTAGSTGSGAISFMAQNTGQTRASTLFLDNVISNTVGNSINIAAGNGVGGIIQVGGTGTVVFSNAVGITLNSGSGALTFNIGSTGQTPDAQVNGPITGAGSIIKSGAGVLALTGASSFTGGTVINAGTLNLDDTVNNGTPTVTGTITVNSGGTLLLGANNVLGYNTGSTGAVTTVNINGGTLTNGIAASISNQGYYTTFVMTGGTANSTNGASIDFASSSYGITTIASSTTAGWSIPILLRSANSMTINTAVGTTPSGIDLSLSGIIADAGDGYGFTKSGAGALQLTAANTYSGTTTISAGTLLLGNQLAAQNSIVSIGAGTGTLGTNNGLEFQTGLGTGDSFTIGGLSGASNEALLDTGAHAVALTIGNDNDTGMTYTGILSGGGSLIKVGTGIQTLSGANTYSGGTTISGGIPRVPTVTAMPSTGTVAVQTGGTLAVQVGTGSYYTNATSGAGSIGGLLAGTGGQGESITYSGNAALGIDTTNIAPYGSFSYAGNIATAGITKLGTGLLSLSGVDTYTGPTTVSAGTLEFANESSLYNDNTASWVGSNIIVKSGATLALEVGSSPNFTSSDLTTFLANLTTAGTTTSSATAGFETGSILGLDTTPGNFTYSGAIANGYSGSTLGLTVFGGNTLTLSGSNTYSGATTLSTGTLLLQANSTNTTSSGTSYALGNNTTGLTLGGGTTLALQGNTNNTIFIPSTIVEVGNGSADFESFNFSAGDSNSGTTTGQTLILAGFGEFGSGNTTPIFNFAVNNNYTLQIGAGTAGTGQLLIYNPTAINSTAAGGTLSIPGGIKDNFTGSYPLYFGGAGNITSGAIILNGGANTFSVTVDGPGTTTLSGVNTYTGATTVYGGTLAFTGLSTGVTALTVIGGTLNDDYTGSVTGNILASTDVLTLGGAGGIFEVNGSTASSVNSQTLASLTLTGAGTLQMINNNSGATTTGLTFSSSTITRSTGGSVDFVEPASGTSITLTGGGTTSAGSILAPYAFFTGGANTEAYAALTSGVVGAASLASDSAGSGGANNFQSATTSYAYTSPGATDTLTASASAFAADFNTSGAQTISLGASNYNLSINGILNTGGALTIQNGSGGTGSVVIPATSGGNTELVIGGNSNVTISAPITGASGILSDDDTGTLTLSSSNTYTGASNFNAGTTSLTSTGYITGGASSAITVGYGATFNEASGAAIGAATSFTSDGTTTLAGINNYTGSTNVNAGTLNISGSLGATATAGQFNVGVAGGPNATLNILPGASVTLSNTGGTQNNTNSDMEIGAGSTTSVGEGFVYQSGGAVSGISQLTLGSGRRWRRAPMAITI